MKHLPLVSCTSPRRSGSSTEQEAAALFWTLTHSACVPPTTRTNPPQWYLPSLVSDLCNGLVTLSLLACPWRNMTMPCLRQRLKTGRLATWMILIHTAVTLVSPPDTQIIPWVASSHARQAPVVNLDRYEGRREGRPP